MGPHVGVHRIQLLSHFEKVRSEENVAWDLNEVFANGKADGYGTEARSASPKLINDDESLRCDTIDNVIHLREGFKGS